MEVIVDNTATAASEQFMIDDLARSGLTPEDWPILPVAKPRDFEGFPNYDIILSPTYVINRRDSQRDKYHAPVGMMPPVIAWGDFGSSKISATVEGAKKARAFHLATGIPTLVLQGCWGFVEPGTGTTENGICDGGIQLHSDILCQIQPDSVHLVLMDGDWRDNYNVRSALGCYRALLEEHALKPLCLDLECDTNGRRLGADDWLLRTYGTIRAAWPGIEAVRRAILKIKQIEAVEIPASRSFVASTDGRYTIENAALTDAGDANLLLRNVGYDNIRYLVDQSVFARWVDGWWQRLEGTPLDLISGVVARAHAVRAAAILKALPKDRADDTATQKSQRAMAKAITDREHHLGGAGARKAVLECLMNKAEIRCDSNDFDMDPYLLGVLDGVVDLRTGQLRPAMQADKLLRRCPIHYRYPLTSTKEGQTHDFASFIAEICGASRDKDGKVILDLAAVDYLQRRFGLMLLGKNENQVFTVLPGKGANGKSVLFDLIASALGSTSNGGYFNRSSIASILSSFRPTDANAATPYLMTFKGARITALSEANEQSMFDPSAVKILTGETEVAGRANYGSATVIRITTNMCLMTNVIPKISHHDQALLSRLDIIPFEVRWRRQNDDDPEVRDFPAADTWWAGEASQDKTILRDLLHWLVEGCVLELTQPLVGKPDRFNLAKASYVKDNDPFELWLNETGWTFEEGAGPTLSGDLYDSYKVFTEQSGGKPVSRVSFGKRFFGQYDQKIKSIILSGGRNAIIGIKRVKEKY